MKYKIVYPRRFHYHPVFLVGKNPEGKPIYRFNSTTPPTKKSMSPSQRVLLASVFSQLAI